MVEVIGLNKIHLPAQYRPEECRHRFAVCWNDAGCAGNIP